MTAPEIEPVIVCAVTGVPKTVVNDAVEILGALPPDVFVEQALAQPGP